MEGKHSVTIYPNNTATYTSDDGRRFLLNELFEPSPVIVDKNGRRLVAVATLFGGVALFEIVEELPTQKK